MARRAPGAPGVTWGDFERGFITSVTVTTPAALHAHAEQIRDAATVTTVTLLDFYEASDPVPEEGIPWLRTLRLPSEAGLGMHRHKIRSLLDATPELVLTAYHDVSRILDGRTRPLDRFAIEGRYGETGTLMTRLAALGPLISGLRELRLGTKFVDADTGYFEDPTLRLKGAETIAGANLTQLGLLDLARQRITSRGLAVIMASVPALRELDASACELDTVRGLDSHGAPLLRLNLANNALGDRGIEPMWTAPRCAAIETLSLDTCELGAVAVTAMVNAPCWQTLRILDLSRNPLALEGARALATAPLPPQLHTLRLADCDFDTEAASVLATCPWLDQLIELDVADIAFVPELTRSYARVVSIARATGDLRHALDRGWDRVVRLDARELFLSEVLPSRAPPELQALRIAECEVTFDELNTILAYPRLRVLDLSGCKFDDLDAVVAQLCSRGAGTAVRLDLRGVELSPRHLIALACSQALRHVTIKSRGWVFGEHQATVTRRFGNHWEPFFDPDEPSIGIDDRYPAW